MDALVNSKIGPPGGNTKRQSFEGSVKCSDGMVGIQGQAQIESDRGNAATGSSCMGMPGSTKHRLLFCIYTGSRPRRT